MSDKLVIDRWRHTRKEPPEAGGSYVVGGYTNNDGLRLFERGFARVRMTLDGPEWEWHDAKASGHIPMMFWHDTLPHPEHASFCEPTND